MGVCARSGKVGQVVAGALIKMVTPAGADLTLFCESCVV